VLYRGRWIESRLGLTRSAGVWLDYWLFLHNDEAHSIWCARPFGVQRLAIAALDTNSKTDRVMRQQLAREALAVARLSPFSVVVAPEPSGEPLQSQTWAPTWLKWFERLAKSANPLVIANELTVPLAEALSHADWWMATFLTRRLAAELADEEWSRRVLFQTARSVILARSELQSATLNRDALIDVLRSVFTAPMARHYEVTVPITTVMIGKEVARRVQSMLKVEFVAGAAWHGLDVIAIRVFVQAVHIEEATARALDRVREALERLRTFHYIRAHLLDSASVRAGDETDTTIVRMPQPFWTKASTVIRPVPTLPRGFDVATARLPETQSRRWTAARWHLSQSLADWSEDAHSAASHAWQALESFSGGPEGGWRQVLSLIPEYLEHLPVDLATYLGRSLTIQRQSLHWSGYKCNWLPWASGKASVEVWVNRVLSSDQYRAWRPTPPEILFDSRVGLLRLVNESIQSRKVVPWMYDRMHNDFALLYSLRNRVVHTGQRLFGRPAAAYLARTAIEVLLALMTSRTAHLSSQRGTIDSADS